MNNEFGLGRNITWTLRAVAEGFSEAIEVPKHIGAAWKHWTRDNQLHALAHRFHGNGAMATLRTAVLNLLRLAGLHSFRAAILAVRVA